MATENRARPHRLEFRVNDKELKKILKAVKKSEEGTLASYMRECALHYAD